MKTNKYTIAFCGNINEVTTKLNLIKDMFGGNTTVAEFSKCLRECQLRSTIRNQLKNIKKGD